MCEHPWTLSRFPDRHLSQTTILPTPDVLVSSLRISATVMNLILIKFLRVTEIGIINLKITPLPIKMEVWLELS